MNLDVARAETMVGFDVLVGDEIYELRFIVSADDQTISEVV